MENSEIIIVGLGPGAPGDLTQEALKVFRASSIIYLRTAKHPTVPFLPEESAKPSFDDLYDRCTTFSEVYDSIVTTLLEKAAKPDGKPVVYAVPGHPLVGEASVLKLLARAREAKIKTRVVPGLSFIEPVLTTLGLDPLPQGLVILDATELAEQTENYLPREKGFGLPVLRPLLISQVYNQRLAGSVKLTLMEHYADDHPVILLRAAGVAGEEGRLDIPLYELDRHPEWTDHLTCAYLPPLEILAARRSFEQVQYVVARLRSPGGCPWDQEQTHASLKRYLLEETYEVLHALEEEPEKLAEELGDLLLQVLLHAQIASEEGEFDIGEVMGLLSDKMIRRHPHVFGSEGDEKIYSGNQEIPAWESLKKAERAQKGEVQESVLDGVPTEMPALLQAQNLQRKAAGLGFEWRNFEDILDKLVEEVREIKDSKNQQELIEEFGDLLSVLVNAARTMKVDAEEALRFANQKFRRRFRVLENLSRLHSLDLHNMPLSELESLWQKAKQIADSPGLSK